MKQPKSPTCVWNFYFYSGILAALVNKYKALSKNKNCVAEGCQTYRLWTKTDRSEGLI